MLFLSTQHVDVSPTVEPDEQSNWPATVMAFLFSQTCEEKVLASVSLCPSTLVGCSCPVYQVPGSGDCYDYLFTSSLQFALAPSVTDRANLVICCSKLSGAKNSLGGGDLSKQRSSN